MAISTTATSGLDQTAYDLLAYFALRPQLYYDAFTDIKPTNQSMQGAAVNFTQIADLSAATTALNESTDLTPATMSDSVVTVTLVEQGNVITTTAKLRGTSYIPVDPIVANLIGYNAGLSIDTIARDVLAGGSNVRYASGGTTLPTARNTIEPGDVLVANDVRRALADLRGANVSPFGSYYAATIHPDVSYDLRGQTGAAAWRDPYEDDTALVAA